MNTDHSVLTYNSELSFSDIADRDKLFQTLELSTTVWNRCSELIFNNKPLLRLKVVHHLCYYTLRVEFPNIPSQLIIQTEKSVTCAYRAAKSNKHVITKPFKRYNHSIQLDKRLYGFKKDGTLRITTIDNRVSVTFNIYPKLESMFSKYPMCDPLIFVKNGLIYISFPFRISVGNVLLTKLAIGVDLGIKNVATTSDGIVYSDKNYLANKRRIRYLKRCLRSKRTKSATKHLKKIRFKERSVTKNMVHCLTNKILSESMGNVIVLENLSKIKKNTKRNKEFNNKQSQVPYYMIRQFLTYKAPLVNKQVVTVSPAYTSLTDCRTGLRDGVRRRGRYVGNDGKVLHSDINAAINIAIKSKLPISCNYGSIYGQGIVNSPIVCKSINK